MSRLLLCFALTAATLAAQEGHGYSPMDIERGGQIFLANCANCHGPDGNAVPDVNLASGRFRRAASDQDLVNIVRNGIPGTPMPPGPYSEQQAATIVAFLRNMNKSTGPSGPALTGDPARGKQLVNGKGQCLNCHRVQGQGKFLGPDLSDIGAIRRQSDLDKSLSNPSAEIRLDNHTFRIVAKDGKETVARLLNQDTYSLQGLDANGRLFTAQKANVREFEIMKTSPMPASNGRLTPQEAADIVSYLITLKGGAR